MDITAIIPVRSGSTRCPHKNSRVFFDTNLLSRKIKILQSVPEISKIIVSSSDENLLNIAKSHGVDIHFRDEIYSQSDTSGTKLFKCLSDVIQTKYMMYVTCVTPFVSNQIYSDAISVFREYIESNEYDCVISCQKIQDFLWKDNRPLNYDIHNAPPSQFLPDIFNPTFSFNIISTDYVKKTSSIIGDKPYFYQLDQLQSIDIDTKFDFVISELLYKNGIASNHDIESYTNWDIQINNKSTNLQLLDCTIRDGGYTNNWNYSLDYVINYYKAISLSGVDYFECGFICNELNNKHGIWWNVTEHEINLLKNSISNGSKICAMIPSNNLHLLTSKIKNLDMIRILVNLKKTPDMDISQFHRYVSRLVSLGYQVCINIAYADILSPSEIEIVIEICSISDIYAVYIADTFGSMTQKSISDLFKQLKSHCSSKLGFHGHNNTQNAISNSLFAIECGAELIDCTLSGCGRGGGNTPIELFLLHLQKQYPHYTIEPILQYFQYNTDSSKFAQILHTFTGLHKIHPDKAIEFLDITNNNLTESYQMLKNLNNE